MEQFGLYAQYYDLLYQDKDYVSEVDYINKLIQEHNPSASKLLNLGSGTGKHDYALAQLGYHVTGADLSEEMVSLAIDNTPAELSGRLGFLTGDARQLRLNTTFDTVLSLFHVMSYQVSNKDLADVIDTAYRHLPPGGTFIFDCWYGPGVLTDPPVVRIKRIANDTINVVRLAESVIHPVENTVDVNYTILIKRIDSNEVTEIKETHTMRYLFVKEIEFLIENKFSLLRVNEWLKDKAPGLNSWNAVFILKKL